MSVFDKLVGWAIALCSIFLSVFLFGKSKEAKGKAEVAQKTTEEALGNVIKTGENDEEIQNADRDELINRGSKWMRKP